MSAKHMMKSDHQTDEVWWLSIQLMEHVAIPAFVLDFDGRVIIWNRACERLTGLPADDVVGTKQHWRGFYDSERACLADLVLRNEHSQVKDLYAAQSEPKLKGNGLSAENWCAMPLLGSDRYLAIDAFQILSDDGRLLAVVETLRDMTKLKENQDWVQRQERQLNAALANMAQGLTMFDEQGKLVICNSQFSEIYGIMKSQVKPGLMFDQLIEIQNAAGICSSDQNDFLRECASLVGDERSFNHQFELNNGKIIAISSRAMGSEGWVSTHEDITERRRAARQIEHLAHHDPLTELRNRSSFGSDVERALERCRRGHQFAVMYLDLDHFKSINDTFGHSVGDALLRGVADRLRASVRATDTIGRLGGDEFAIIQSDVSNPNDVSILAHRIIEKLGTVFEIEGHNIVIGGSVGIACAPKDGSTAEELLRAADLALYRAKSNGRGTLQFFDPEMTTSMVNRRTLEADLRHAVEAGQFEVHYQPIFDFSSHQVTCCEALLRWKHPKRGNVSPLEFIPLAEEIGLIKKITNIVLNDACATALHWPSSVKLAVNISPTHFKNGRLFLDVVAALNRSGLPAGRLQLEITEAVLLQDTGNSLSILSELRGLGVSLSLDDFGTGYSSLSYIKKFLFDKIKIDRSFIQDLPNGREANAIINAVIGISSNLGMQTTAEGVETIEQLLNLDRQGCTEVQGWLFSAARPATEILGIIANAPQIWKNATRSRDDASVAIASP